MKITIKLYVIKDSNDNYVTGKDGEWTAADKTEDAAQFAREQDAQVIAEIFNATLGEEYTIECIEVEPIEMSK